MFCFRWQIWLCSTWQVDLCTCGSSMWAAVVTSLIAPLDTWKGFVLHSPSLGWPAAAGSPGTTKVQTKDSNAKVELSKYFLFYMEYVCPQGGCLEVEETCLTLGVQQWQPFTLICLQCRENTAADGKIHQDWGCLGGGPEALGSDIHIRCM